MKLVTILLVVFAVIFILWILAIRCRCSNPLMDELKKYRYAHRGFHEKPYVAENSITAFRHAVDHGFGSELDVHLLADGNLAVIHDSSLMRTCGLDIRIEDMTTEQIRKCRLEESYDSIPTLADVLNVYKNAHLPLIIELKVENGNFEDLCTELYRQLQSYSGLYCIESFDPRAVAWFRRNAPEVARGQLATNFIKGTHSGQGRLIDFVLTNLLMNIIAVPDFIAYEYKYRRNLSLMLARDLWSVDEANWTIRKKKTLLKSESLGNIPIFERFDPEK